ncbi:response regulator [Taibaiella lutea]|uniref:Response regulator n=1 Tax=Taibaiella lutea TaxID=2608001 RepID=A0A5M6CE45_9BACT|nr:response regulator [Taibaiella lutea]KAA5532132.1 response regulator [Taibaiella lutea]
MKKILIVDDNENFLEVLSTLLVTKGEFEVITQRRGADVLEIIQNIKPDFVLLDIFIGETNGLDIYKAIKENIPTRETPVLLMSGSDTSVLSDSGANVIAKPFDLKHLMGKINTMAA